MQSLISQAPDSSLSSHSSPFSSANLSPVQAQVVEALAEGSSVTVAARRAGIHRTTIHHWTRTNPDFKAAAEEAQAEYVATLSDQMRELASIALRTLHRLLESEGIPPAVRLRAALAVLNRPHFPDKGWHLPERIESPGIVEALEAPKRAQPGPALCPRLPAALLAVAAPDAHTDDVAPD